MKQQIINTNTREVIEEFSTYDEAEAYMKQFIDYRKDSKGEYKPYLGDTQVTLQCVFK